MRVTIDIADTPTGSAPLEIRMPEYAVASPTSPAATAVGTMGGEVQRYDGGADMAVPVLPGPMVQTGTPAPLAETPSAAHDGGAAPSTESTEPDDRLPGQIEAPAHLIGGIAPD